MNVGSLFSGIGGFDHGLERAGMRVVWQCEANEYRRAVLRKHWPHVPCFDDVRAVCADNAEPVDLICGGFPCQDLSLAGKGAGIDGARSGLWSEFARIVGELRPRYVVVENVPALAHRGLGRVLGDLAACGYDAEWDCLPASAFGAPHRRDRLWLVAYAQRDQLREQPAGLTGSDAAPIAGVNGETRPLADDSLDGCGSRRQGRLDPGGAREPERALSLVADASRDAEAGTASSAGTERERAWQSGEPSGACSDSFGNGLEGQQQAGPAPRPAFGDSGWWATEPDVGRVAHGVPARVDRLSALGDALVPQIAEWIGRRILESESERLGLVG